MEYKMNVKMPLLISKKALIDSDTHHGFPILDNICPNLLWLYYKNWIKLAVRGQSSFVLSKWSGCHHRRFILCSMHVVILQRHIQLLMYEWTQKLVLHSEWQLNCSNATPATLLLGGTNNYKIHSHLSRKLPPTIARDLFKICLDMMGALHM